MVSCSPVLAWLLLDGDNARVKGFTETFLFSDNILIGTDGRKKDQSPA